MKYSRSSVKLGDERKKGVERAWCSEYGSCFAGKLAANDEAPPGSLKVCFEEILAEKIVQRSIHGPHMARTALRQLDKDRTGLIEGSMFREFLKSFNVTTSDEEIDRALVKYESGENGCIDHEKLLAAVLPDEFGASNTVTPPPLDHRSDWFKWNTYRIAERGTKG